MLLYTIRHAESLANAELAESLNTGLSPLGFQQAEALARRFEHVSMQAVYSSPFRRSIETAVPLSGTLGLPIRIRPELCEFQGLTSVTSATQVKLGLDDIDAIAWRHPQVSRCPDYGGAYQWPPADESVADMIARTRSFARYLKARWHQPEDTVVVIGHGSPIARLIEAWLTDQPGPAFRFTIDNAAVAALRYVDEVSSLVCLNEISHLRVLPVSPRGNYREDGSIKPVPPGGYW
jgi:broad specificity phosphatase PhoE